MEHRLTPEEWIAKPENKERSQIAINWITNWDFLLNMSAIARQIEIDKSNFRKCLKGTLRFNNIQLKILTELVEGMKQYGNTKWD